MEKGEEELKGCREGGETRGDVRGREGRTEKREEEEELKEWREGHISSLRNKLLPRKWISCNKIK